MGVAGVLEFLGSADLGERRAAVAPGVEASGAVDVVGVENRVGDPKIDLDRSTEVPELAFVVPADFTRGTLVVSGTRQASGTRDDGSTATFRLTLPRTPVPFTLAGD